MTEDVTPGKEAGFNVRTTVHEYGGGALIAGSGVVYFSNFKCGFLTPLLVTMLQGAWLQSSSVGVPPALMATPHTVSPPSNGHGAWSAHHRRPLTQGTIS